jgi:beta-1,4-mannosyltransferase
MKTKAYIYPITSRLKTGIHNPYLDNFISSSEQNIVYLNKNHPSGKGIFDLQKYLGKMDVVFLNWIENLPEKKGGYLQSIFLLTLLKLKKKLGFKVVWTLHNKISHSSSHFHLKKLLVNQLLKKSDLIITHAREGIHFAEELCPGVSSRIFYFPHPVVPANGAVSSPAAPEYDILIWGTMAPYKGIDNFLDFLEKNGQLDKYRILIAGKAINENFFRKIKKYESKNIRVLNQFIDHKTLQKLILSSRLVLFTYSGTSVLSSGALMDSLANKAVILGPAVGAFSEMGNLGVIKTYTDFTQLIELLQKPDLFHDEKFKDRIDNFLSQHTWEKFNNAFSDKIMEILDSQKQQQH